MDKFVNSDTVIRINFLKDKIPALFREIVKLSTTNVWVSDLKIPQFISEKQIEVAVEHPNKIVYLSFNVLYHIDQAVKILANKNSLFKECIECVVQTLEVSTKLKEDYGEVLGDDNDTILLNGDLETLKTTRVSLETLEEQIKLDAFNNLIAEQDQNWENYQRSFAEEIRNFLAQNGTIRLNELELTGLLEDQPVIIANKKEILSNAGLNVTNYSDFKINLCCSLKDYQARNLGENFNLSSVLEQCNEILAKFERGRIELRGTIENAFLKMIRDLRAVMVQVEAIQLLNPDDVQRIKTVQRAYQQRIEFLEKEKQQNIENKPNNNSWVMNDG